MGLSAAKEPTLILTFPLKGKGWWLSPLSQKWMKLEMLLNVLAETSE